MKSSAPTKLDIPDRAVPIKVKSDSIRHMPFFPLRWLHDYGLTLYDVHS